MNLKTLIGLTNEEIVTNTPSEKRLSITIVGPPKEYSKEEMVQMLLMQNGVITQFANSNDIDVHIQILGL